MPILMTIEQIKTAVCEAFGIEESELFEKTRSKKLAYPRYAFNILVKEHLNMGIMELAMLFSKKHSTIIYALDRHNELKTCNLRYKINFKKAENKLKNL